MNKNQPGTTDAAFESAKEAINSQDWVRARELLTPIVEADQIRAAKFFLARAEFEDGNSQQARIWLDPFLEKQPKHLGGLVLRARIFAKDGDQSAAEESLQTALNLNPDFLPAQRALAQIQTDKSAIVAAELIEVIDAGHRAARDGKPSKALLDAAKKLAALPIGPDWNNEPIQAKIAYFHNAKDIDLALRNYDPHLIEISCELDYITWPKRIQDYVRHKSIIDVGCGFGGYGMGFLVAGATGYVGLDPVMNLDSTRAKNKRIRQWSDMGVTPRAIAEALPAISLFQGTAEDLEFDEKFDTIALHNVTEHLIQLDLVFEGLVPLCKPETRIVFLHHNFYCWNGHHFAPNQPGQLDKDNPKHLEIYDWNHIEFAEDLPEDHYFQTHLNRVRLDEIRRITEKHFDIQLWEEIPSNKATLERLTPEILTRIQKTHPDMTETELATNVVFCVALKK